MRNELPFRGIRWTGLRRLNRDPRFLKTIRRSYPNEEGEAVEAILLQGDPRYWYFMPMQVIEKSCIVQTKPRFRHAKAWLNRGLICLIFNFSFSLSTVSVSFFEGVHAKASLMRCFTFEVPVVIVLIPR